MSLADFCYHYKTSICFSFTVHGPICCVKWMVCFCFEWTFWFLSLAVSSCYVYKELTTAVRQKTRYSGQPGVRVACQLWQTYTGWVWKTETEVSEWAAPRLFVVFSAFSLPLTGSKPPLHGTHWEGFTGEISVTQISCQAAIKNSTRLELMHLMSVLFNLNR